MYMFTWLFLVWIAPPLKSAPRKNFHFFLVFFLGVWGWGGGVCGEINWKSIKRLDCSRLSDGEDCPNKNCRWECYLHSSWILIPLNDPLEQANKRPPQGSWREGGGGGGGGGLKVPPLRQPLVEHVTVLKNVLQPTKQFDVDIINLQRILKT